MTLLEMAVCDLQRLGGPIGRGNRSGRELISPDSSNQWLFLVPLKGGIGSIFHPPGSARTISVVFLSGIFFLPIGGWTMPPTSHLSGEPVQQPLIQRPRGVSLYE